MVKSVMKQFHSCTGKVLPILLHKLGPDQDGDNIPTLPWGLVQKALSHMLCCMLEHTNKENVQVVWDCFYDAIIKLHDHFTIAKANKEDILEQLNRLLQLFQQLLQKGDGGLVVSPTKLVEMIEKLLSGPVVSCNCCDTLVEIISTLLCAPRCDLNLNQTSSLVTKILKGKYGKKKIFTFVSNLHEQSWFEKVVLPGFLDFCYICITSNNKQTRKDALQALASLANTKRPMIIDASHLASYQPYHFDFSLALEKRNKDKPTIIQEYVLSLLNVNSIDICSESNQAGLWGALCCIPHIRPMDKTKCKEALRNTITKLAQLLPSLEDPLK
ncbi:small subunit processome component 20 homolog, partial [Anneissia japonica]|uniref:small subunit processome component 20 homolog n=1 Tax=Anneissia japonica TaxID=1529436 RepID=UPI001425BB99